jgi:predicted RNA-binding protein YlxR (DUF448 family)
VVLGLAQEEQAIPGTGESGSTDAMRRCAATREVRPKAELIRFVLSPDGDVVPDLKESLPGRGVWLTASKDVVALAVKRNAFSRSLKTAAKAAPDLAERLGRMLHEQALRAFSLANKAGAVTFGFTKLETALEKGRVYALVHAKDAAEDGCRKLNGKYRAIAGGAALPPICGFTAGELSLASGRPNVVHAALAQGGAAAKFIAAANRAERYEQATTPEGMGPEGDNPEAAKRFGASDGPDTDKE